MMRNKISEIREKLFFTIARSEDEQNQKTNIFSNPTSLKLSFVPGHGKRCILGHPTVYELKALEKHRSIQDDLKRDTEFLRMSSGYKSETLSFSDATRQYPMAWFVQDVSNRTPSFSGTLKQYAIDDAPRIQKSFRVISKILAQNS